MPLYEYKCEKCGHEFDRLAKMSDPNPPCPALTHPKYKGLRDPELQKLWRETKEAITKGEEIDSRWHGGGAAKVGPDFEVNIIFSIEPLEQQNQTLKDWVDEMSECGGETRKLISKSDFHLKGGGWYSDGY